MLPDKDNPDVSDTLVFSVLNYKLVSAGRDLFRLKNEVKCPEMLKDGNQSNGFCSGQKKQTNLSGKLYSESIANNVKH